MDSDDFPVRRSASTSWREPFHWWGPPWNSSKPMSLAQLIELETISSWQAAWLVEHLRGGGSIIVAAAPQGGGKSTLAAALIEELPGDRDKVYLRGMYEPFDWVDVSAVDSTAILVNEISPHLPIYAWGETVRRLLTLAESGYQIIGTAHADSVEELLAQLASYPIQATAAQLAVLQVVVFLTDTVVDDNIGRRVGSIVSLSLSGVTGGLISISVADCPARADRAVVRISTPFVEGG